MWISAFGLFFQKPISFIFFTGLFPILRRNDENSSLFSKSLKNMFFFLSSSFFPFPFGNSVDNWHYDGYHATYLRTNGVWPQDGFKSQLVHNMNPITANQLHPTNYLDNTETTSIAKQRRDKKSIDYRVCYNDPYRLAFHAPFCHSLYQPFLFSLFPFVVIGHRHVLAV